MSNPIEELLEYEKTAGLGTFLSGVGRGVVNLSGKVDPSKGVKLTEEGLKIFQRGGQLGQQMQTGAALAAGGALITGLGLAAKKINDAVSKRRDFREMMSLHPELSEEQGRNPKMFNAAYSSLRNINPTFGRDPLVAGAHMKQFMDNPDTAGLMVARTIRPPDAPRSEGSGFSANVNLGPLSYQRRF